MPNYRYVATSKFEPFTFDEMLKPALLAQAKHDEIEKAYGELGENAEEWGSRIDEINDPTSYARYKQYENAFDENYQSFSKHGLNHKSNKALMDVKRYYKNRVKPIEDAWITRKALQDEVRKLYAANPTLLVQNNILDPGAASSLDRWLENPSYDYGKTYSGATITKQVSESLAHIAKSLTSYGKGVQLDDYTNTFVKQFGYTPQKAYEAMQAYLANPNASNDFVSKVINSVIDSSGIRSWDNEEALNRAYNYGAQAIPAIIGTGDVSPIDNFEKRQEVINGYKNPPKDLTSGGIHLNPTPLRTKNEDIDNKLNHYSKYFKQDAKGNWYLTKEGRDLMNNYSETSIMYPGASQASYDKRAAEALSLRGFITEDLGFNLRKIGTHQKVVADQPYNIGNAYKRYVDVHEGAAYDTYKSTVYPIQLDDETGKAWLKAIKKEYPDGIPVYEFRKDKGETRPQYKQKKKISLDDLDKDATASFINLSNYGNTVDIDTKDGVITTMIPKHLNQTSYDASNYAMNMAEEYRAIYEKGLVPETTTNSNGKEVVKKDKRGQIVFTNTPLSSEQMFDLAGRYQQEITKAHNATFGSVQVNNSKKNVEVPQSSVDTLPREIADLLDQLQQQQLSFGQ